MWLATIENLWNLAIGERDEVLAALAKDEADFRYLARKAKGESESYIIFLVSSTDKLCFSNVREVFLCLHRSKRCAPVSVDKILAWIKVGELRAINAATTQKGRPRFLISRDDLELFEASRAVVPPPALVKRRRRDTEGESLTST